MLDDARGKVPGRESRQIALTAELHVQDVHTHQSGMIGLVRGLHGLEMAILRVEIVQKENIE